jgi:sugar lactone lactonase YvrE
MLRLFAMFAVVCALLAPAGCRRPGDASADVDKIWGRLGLEDGKFQKPRAACIDDQGRIYIVDMTARIQVFDEEGNFIRAWKSPDHTVGRPSGLSIDRQGRLLVSDTHYYQVLIYSPEGELVERLGGTKGEKPGEFGLVTDAAEDSQGNLYVAEYGEFDRIQKFSPTREFLLQWGGHGEELGQFVRPQKMWIDAQDRIWVTDACNHRIQVFDTEGKLLFHWGKQGSGLGELSYPYDISLDADGNVLVTEWGNHRIQKFTQDGKSLGVFGTYGRKKPGEFFHPWGSVIDRQGRIHIIDSQNHRVQRVRM